MSGYLKKLKTEYFGMRVLALAFLLTATAFMVLALNARAASNVSSDIAAQNSYLLRVDTGVSGGSDIASFVVRYKAKNRDKEYSEVILPNDGDFSETYQRANNTAGGGSTTELTHRLGLIIARDYGYLANGWTLETAGSTTTLSPKFDELESLQVGSVNEYVFTTVRPVEKFVAVDVIHSGSGTTNIWTCRGMQIIKLEAKTDSEQADIAVKMNGIYSNSTTLTYKGTLVAEVTGSALGGESEYRPLGELSGSMPNFGKSGTTSKIYRISTGESSSQNNISLKLVNITDAQPVGTSSKQYTVKILDRHRSNLFNAG